MFNNDQSDLLISFDDVTGHPSVGSASLQPSTSVQSRQTATDDLMSFMTPERVPSPEPETLNFRDARLLFEIIVQKLNLIVIEGSVDPKVFDGFVEERAHRFEAHIVPNDTTWQEATITYYSCDIELQKEKKKVGDTITMGSDTLSFLDKGNAIEQVMKGLLLESNPTKFTLKNHQLCRNPVVQPTSATIFTGGDSRGSVIIEGDYKRISGARKMRAWAEATRPAPL